MNDSMVLYTQTYSLLRETRVCFSVLIYISVFMYVYLSTQHSIVYIYIHTVHEYI